jgi:hypothetical protein
VINSKINDLAMTVKKAEENLKRIKGKKEDIRKRRMGSSSSGGSGSKLGKMLMMML